VCSWKNQSGVTFYGAVSIFIWVKGAGRRCNPSGMTGDSCRLALLLIANISTSHIEKWGGEEKKRRVLVWMHGDH